MSITPQMEFDGGFVKQRKELERLMMTDPSMEKRVQNIIRDTLKAVRSVVSSDAASAMKADPRQAYKAVRTSVYRRILGGIGMIQEHVHKRISRNLQLHTFQSFLLSRHIMIFAVQRTAVNQGVIGSRHLA